MSSFSDKGAESMILPCEREPLSRLTRSRLKSAILERRLVIREHRDAKGDERCWLDDYLVWDMIPSRFSSSLGTLRFSSTVGMEECRLFYNHRRSETLDPTSESAILDPRDWDKDIRSMTYSQLLDGLVRMQEAIRNHRDIHGRPRTVHDDRVLYLVLPERVPADFRLPPKDEFLGRAKTGAGCPNFWDSHAHCGQSCNLHAWGPCEEKN